MAGGAVDRKLARIQRSADVRYKGQSFALSIPVDEPDPDAISAAFAAEHERTYGHRAEQDPVELVNVRVEVAVPQAATLRWGQSVRAAERAGAASRSAYFGAAVGELPVPVLDRRDLTAQPQAGPLIVEEYDTTIVVAAGLYRAARCAAERRARCRSGRMKRHFDPLGTEILKNALESLVDEMAMTVLRTAYSNNLKNSMDFSTALCQPSGELVAQGLTLPLHLGSVPHAMQSIRAAYGDDTHPGDVFILNDPYAGGTHLPDIYVVKPIFWQGTLACYLSSPLPTMPTLVARSPAATAAMRPRFTKKVSASRR